ncbi:hypothetical protein [Kaistia sp. UC242_56]|uniref:hypothetical protein n=1 Tax=Kaistia sp. UC242_56 TaxID=3374625 RepID=UPI00378998FF
MIDELGWKIEAWLRRIAGEARQAFQDERDTQAGQRHLSAGVNDRVTLRKGSSRVILSRKIDDDLRGHCAAGTSGRAGSHGEVESDVGCAGRMSEQQDVVRRKDIGVHFCAVYCAHPRRRTFATAPPPRPISPEDSGGARVNLALKIHTRRGSEHILFVQHCLDANVIDTSEFLSEQQ